LIRKGVPSNQLPPYVSIKSTNGDKKNTHSYVGVYLFFYIVFAGFGDLRWIMMWYDASEKRKSQEAEALSGRL
jgi:hypothetical protein